MSIELENDRFVCVYAKAGETGPLAEVEQRAYRQVNSRDSNRLIDDIRNTMIEAGWTLVNPYPGWHLGQTSLLSEHLAGQTWLDIQPIIVTGGKFPIGFPFYVQLLDPATGRWTVFCVVGTTGSAADAELEEDFPPPEGATRWYVSIEAGVDATFPLGHAVYQIRGLAARASVFAPGFTSTCHTLFYADRYATEDFSGRAGGFRRASALSQAYEDPDFCPRSGAGGCGAIPVGPGDVVNVSQVSWGGILVGTIDNYLIRMNSCLFKNWEVTRASVPIDMVHGSFLTLPFIAKLGFDRSTDQEPDGSCDWTGTRGNNGLMWMNSSSSPYYSGTPNSYGHYGGGWLLRSKVSNDRYMLACITQQQLNGAIEIRISGPGDPVMDFETADDAFYYGHPVGGVPSLLSGQQFWPFIGGLILKPPVYRIIATPYSLLIVDIANEEDSAGAFALGGNSFYCGMPMPTPAQIEGGFNGGIVVIGPGQLKNSLLWTQPVAVSFNMAARMRTATFGGASTPGLWSHIFPFELPMRTSNEKALVGSCWLAASEIQGIDCRGAGLLHDSIVISEKYKSGDGPVQFDGHTFVRVAGQGVAPHISWWMAVG